MTDLRSIARTALGALRGPGPAGAAARAADGRPGGAARPAARRAGTDESAYTATRNGRAYRLGFLLGVGKSGTNWVGAILNLHPRLLCEGEFHFQYFLDGYRWFVGPRWQVGHQRPAVREAVRRALEELVRQGLVAAAEARPEAEWIIDRSPRPFEALLPGAPHVYLLRDGRDVLVSHTFHHLRVNRPEQVPEPLRAAFARHVATFKADPNAIGPDRPGPFDDEPWVRFHARRWAEQVRQDLARIDGPEAAAHPARVLKVRYEDLHADPEGQRRRLYEHFGVDPAEAAPLSATTRTNPGFGREDRTSFWRKGEPGDWRRYGSERFRRWFREEAGDVLVQTGYEGGTDW